MRWTLDNAVRVFLGCAILLLFMVRDRAAPPRAQDRLQRECRGTLVHSDHPDSFQREATLGAVESSIQPTEQPPSYIISPSQEDYTGSVQKAYHVFNLLCLDTTRLSTSLKGETNAHYAQRFRLILDVCRSARKHSDHGSDNGSSSDRKPWRVQSRKPHHNCCMATSPRLESIDVSRIYNVVVSRGTLTTLCHRLPYQHHSSFTASTPPFGSFPAIHIVCCH
jgi:hypothetical protein